MYQKYQLLVPNYPQKIREDKSLKILGINFETSWSSMIKSNYTRLISKLKATMQMHNVRRLNIIERCIVLNIYILSKLWYIAQILPPSNAQLGQIKSACGKFIWSSFVFKVERNQLYLDYTKGGLRLVDPEAKAKALFLKNIFYNYDEDGNIVEEKYLIDCNFIHKLTRNAREWLQEGLILKNNFTLKTTKLLYAFFIDKHGHKPKIESKMNRNWENIWENINSRFINFQDRARMYALVNDIIPNKEKLQAYGIGHVISTCCEKCNLPDSNDHRIKKCKTARIIWDWCRHIIQNRLKVEINNIEDILQLKVPARSKQMKAALWLVCKAISFNLRVQEPVLYLFKKEIREERWNKRKLFLIEFGNLLNIC